MTMWTVTIDGVVDQLSVEKVNLDRRLQTSFPETVRNPVGAVIGGGTVSVRRAGGWSPWQVDDVKGAVITVDQTVQGTTRRKMTGTVHNVVGLATSDVVSLEVTDRAGPLVGLPTTVPMRSEGMHSQWVAWWCLMQAGLQPLWHDPAWTDMAPLCGCPEPFAGVATGVGDEVFDIGSWGLALVDGKANFEWVFSVHGVQHPDPRADVWRLWITVDPADPATDGVVALRIGDNSFNTDGATVQVSRFVEDLELGHADGDIGVTAWIDSPVGPSPNATLVSPPGDGPITVVAEWRESAGGDNEVRWSVWQDGVEIADEDWQEPSTNTAWISHRGGWQVDNLGTDDWAVGGAGVRGYDGAAQPIPTVVHPGGNLRQFGQALTVSDPGNLPEGAWAILGSAATASRSALWTDGAGLVQALGADDIASADPTVELTESNAGPIPWATSLDDLAASVAIPGQTVFASFPSTVYDESIELTGENRQPISISWDRPVRLLAQEAPPSGENVYADSDLSGSPIGQVTVTRISTGSTSARLEVRNLAGVEGYFGWQVRAEGEGTAGVGSWRLSQFVEQGATGADDRYGQFSPDGVEPFVQSSSVARDLFFALAPELEGPEPQVGPWEVALPSLWHLDVGGCVSFRDDLFSGAIASRALVVGWKVATDGQPLLELRVLRPTLGAHDQLQAGRTLGDHDTDMVGLTLADHDDDPLHLFGAF